MKKTKKALLALLACSVALAGAFGLAACNNKDNSNDDNGDTTTHSHTWSSWTVTDANKPTDSAAGKATRTCSGSGTCDAAATDKEAALPALTSSDYTKTTKTTATCKTDGVVTYTYNKGGVNVSFDVNTGKDANNHEANCGHEPDEPQPAQHVHQWSEWTIDQADLLHYSGIATRECTSMTGVCDADESLLQVEVPSVMNSETYTYAAPVHKKEATCKEHGIDTYTYEDKAKGISISFDVETALGEHHFEGNECTVCHMPVVKAELNTEAEVSVTAELGAILEFTAAEEGLYEFDYTDGSGASIKYNGQSTGFPNMYSLDANEKVSFSIAAPTGTASATYKFKVVRILSLEPNTGDPEDETDPNNPYVVPSSLTVNVGGGKTARVNVSGSRYGVISYTGNTPITVSYSEYDYVQGVITHTYTLAGTTALGAQDNFTVEFGFYGVFDLTISSEAEEAFDAEISLLLVDGDPATENVITVGEPKSFENVDYEGKTYTVEINDAGDYKFKFEDVAAEDVYLMVSTENDDEITPNEDGSFTLEANTTYQVFLSSNKSDPDNMGAYLPVSGTLTITAPTNALTLNTPVTVTGVDTSVWDIEPKIYSIELQEGNYQVVVNNQIVELNMGTAVMIGKTYSGGYLDLIYGTKDDNDKETLLVITEAGQYYVEVQDNVTFKIVAEGTVVDPGTDPVDPEEPDVPSAVNLTLDGTFVELVYDGSKVLNLVAKDDSNPNGFEVGETYTLNTTTSDAGFLVGEGTMPIASTTITYEAGMTVTIAYVGFADSVNAIVTVQKVTAA